MDTDKTPLIPDIVTILNIIFGEKSWNSYDQIDFEIIRAELENQGYTLKPKRRHQDDDFVTFV